MNTVGEQEEKIKIADNDDNPLMRTYTITDEDHTLGNVLTYTLDRLEETEFCAYTLGHPQDKAIHIRLKVKPGNTADKVLEKGLLELKTALGIVKSKFKRAMKDYEQC